MFPGQMVIQLSRRIDTTPCAWSTESGKGKGAVVRNTHAGFFWWKGRRQMHAATFLLPLENLAYTLVPFFYRSSRFVLQFRVQYIAS